MLRSIQTLRDTSANAQILASHGHQLAMSGGGDDYYMPWHWHDCLMLLMPRVGSVEFRDETRKGGAWLSEDRFVIVPQAFSHQTAAGRTGHDHLAIYATDGQLAEIEWQFGSLSRVRAKLGAPAFYSTSPEMRSLLGLCRADEPSDLATQSARGHLVAALLIHCLRQTERGEQLPASTPASHGDALISEVKAYISNNLATDLPLDLIRDRFGLSRRHVTRLFREKTGMTISEFHERERVDQARDLLGATDLPVGEVAWRVGLESGSALARMMRRVIGITPTDARRMAQFDKH